MTSFRLDEVWIRRVFFALALLYVLPFWTVRYLPTTDGACHTYNAWILRQYGNTAEYPLYRQYYEINARPYPNWISQATMALLMFVVPPVTAEKILVSGYVLLFLGGLWYLAGSLRPEDRWPAFLGFPFAYNQLFQNGFYNFSISVALFLFVLGCWWRHRSQPGLVFALQINLLLWLCYFSHILSFALALAAIAVLWLATLRRESWRRHLLHFVVLAPQVALPLWFFWVQGRERHPSNWPLRRLLLNFVELHALFPFGEIKRWAGATVALAFLLLVVLTLRRQLQNRAFPRQADAFLLLFFLFAVLYFFSPAGMSGGGLLKERLGLYPYLLLIPWLSPRLGQAGKQTAAAALTAVALLNLGYLLYWYDVRGGELERFLSRLDAVQPHSRVLTIFFQRPWPTDTLSHAVGYKAIEKGLIDWDNYEAKVAFFPTRFRDSVALPNLEGIFFTPWTYRVAVNRDRVDAVYTWQMPPGTRLRRRLRSSYVLSSKGDGAELWERKRRRPGEESPPADVVQGRKGRRQGPGARL